MSPWQVWRFAVFSLPALVSVASCAVMVFALARRPSRTLAYFLCFYALATAHFLAKLVPPALFARAGFLGLDASWRVGQALSRLRFLFLLLFVRSVRRSPVVDGLSAALGLFVIAGMAAPFFAYTRIPTMMEATVTLYSIVFLAAALAMPGFAAKSGRDPKEGIDAADLGLAKAYLLCSGFFLIGLTLDFVESVPSIGSYVSVFLIDFQPLYHACLGAAAAFAALRAIRARAPAELPDPSPGVLPDVSALPLSAREREIAALMLQGLTNAQIADRLFIAESTVKKHVNNAFRKLGIASRWELLKLGSRIHPKE